ncbi:MAG: copper amine oxidase N-terminal domain-containing protein [Syntrophomonadaceae bacterium]|nr:copper amine oxidase N-terminal domain-containing protein [Syntrophomonadaceae bacterium]
MNKWWGAVFLLTILILSCIVTEGKAAQAATVILNGKEMKFDVSPVQVKGNVLIPLRLTIESMGGWVVWHGKGRITAGIEGKSVEFIIGEKTAIRNGLHLTLSYPPALINRRVLVPFELFSKAFNAEVSSNLQTNQVLINYKNEDTLKAKAQVLHYLELLEQAFSRNVSQQEWLDVLSMSALTNIRGPQLENRFAGCTISYPRILTWRHGMTDSGPGAILVTASYLINYPNHHKNPGLNIWHKEVFTVIKEQGKWVIDSTREKLRHYSDLPRYVLSQEEAVELERNWQRNNHYTKKEILELNRTLTDPALRLVYASHNWDGPVEAMPSEQKAKYYQIKSLFLPEVINSPGWNAFIGITARYDLFFQVLQSASSEDTVQLRLVADLFAQSWFVPAFMDVELKKEDNAWRISKISNVSAYDSAYQLKIKDPEKFKMLATLYNFWRVRAEWFGIDESFVTL